LGAYFILYKYVLSLASEVNAAPLPPVPEVFGVRLPPASECLTSVDFDLIPHKPPPGVKLYDEEIEEIEESDSEEEEEEEEDADMEPAISEPATVPPKVTPVALQPVREAPFPISAFAAPTDIDMIGPTAETRVDAEEGSEAVEEEEEGLFAGGDDEEEESDAMEEVSTTEPAGGVKRKLVEEDDYD
jgi:transcription initiation factor TFIID subunit 9B